MSVDQIILSKNSGPSVLGKSVFKLYIISSVILIPCHKFNFSKIAKVTEKIVDYKPKLKFCPYRQGKKNAKDSLRFTLYDKVAPKLCISVFWKRLESFEA